MDTKLAFLVLMLLIAANFTALVINAWYMLPNPIDTNAVSKALDRSVEVTGEKRGFKRRIRQGDNSNKNNISDAEMQKEPIRYDKISSLIKTAYGIVHQLPSIPPKRRMIPGTYDGYTIPSDAVTNLTYFLQSRIRDDEEERPLYLYNPSLLSLDEETIDRTIIDNLNVGEAAYIATYRVSNFGNCHGPGRGVPATYHNYIGIALLDEDLNIIQQDGEYCDVVIDLNEQLFGPKRGKTPQSLQDCQIYTAPSNPHTTIFNLLLLQCNEYVMPIRLTVSGAFDEQQSTKGEEVTLHNKYGSKLQLTALHKPYMIIRNGKNMHHFGPGYIETWPSGPHEYVKMDFSSYPFVNSASMKAPGLEPDSSYKTPDNNLIDRDSGSACCVPIHWAENGETKQLLMGFSHRKTRKVPKKDSYNYVSRVYAFEPKPPFNIVARSGLFCLGFANHGSTDAEITQSDNEQLQGSANDYKLTIQQVEYDCPRIHFVTGITEKLHDQNTVIVSYGVNDCYPRMVEINKSFLVDLLKGLGLV
ncbi:hypothetical protein ACHAWO_008075 [Cyclotella atomus]|jgi:hypothetical protein|uniref:Uncharacterized protein n=1 Tax=Cyclotella atomus TaxID=382360 RepID=A0ABD3NQ96_9STRA